MNKTPSYSALRKQIGEALRPIRIALLSKENGEHMPVVFMGYRFTGTRLYKGRGQIGYAWNANYSGQPIGEDEQEKWPTTRYGCVSGGIEDCATQLYARLREQSRNL